LDIVALRRLSHVTDHIANPILPSFRYHSALLNNFVDFFAVVEATVSDLSLFFVYIPSRKNQSKVMYSQTGQEAPGVRLTQWDNAANPSTNGTSRKGTQMDRHLEPERQA